MPNWVRNRVIAEDPAKLKELLLNEKGEVDFNKVIPMPQDLMISAGSNSYQMPTAKVFVDYHKKQLEDQAIIDKELDKLFDESLTQREFLRKVLTTHIALQVISNVKGWDRNSKDFNSNVEQFVAGYYNFQKYGYTDWYEWSRKEWGTKWNASNTQDCGDVIEFETAWCMPYKVFEALAVKLDMPVRVQYADEDLGSNCGLVDFVANPDTNEVDCFELLGESVELANDTWGYGSITVFDEETGDWIEDIDDERVIKANKDYFEMQQKTNALMTATDVANSYEVVQ